MRYLSWNQSAIHLFGVLHSEKSLISSHHFIPITEHNSKAIKSQQLFISWINKLELMTNFEIWDLYSTSNTGVEMNRMCSDLVDWCSGRHVVTIHRGLQVWLLGTEPWVKKQASCSGDCFLMFDI